MTKENGVVADTEYGAHMANSAMGMAIEDSDEPARDDAKPPKGASAKEEGRSNFCQISRSN